MDLLDTIPSSESAGQLPTMENVDTSQIKALEVQGILELPGTLITRSYSVTTASNNVIPMIAVMTLAHFPHSTRKDRRKRPVWVGFRVNNQIGANGFPESETLALIQYGMKEEFVIEDESRDDYGKAYPNLINGIKVKGTIGLRNMPSDYRVWKHDYNRVSEADLLQQKLLAPAHVIELRETNALELVATVFPGTSSKNPSLDSSKYPVEHVTHPLTFTGMGVASLKGELNVNYGLSQGSGEKARMTLTGALTSFSSGLDRKGTEVIMEMNDNITAAEYEERGRGSRAQPLHDLIANGSVILNNLSGTIRIQDASRNGAPHATLFRLSLNDYAPLPVDSGISIASRNISDDEEDTRLSGNSLEDMVSEATEAHEALNPAELSEEDPEQDQAATG